MSSYFTSNVYLFNQIGDDNDFALACNIQTCNELLFSDLVYTSLESDLEKINSHV